MAIRLIKYVMCVIKFFKNFYFNICYSLLIHGIVVFWCSLITAIRFSVRLTSSSFHISLAFTYQPVQLRWLSQTVAPSGTALT